MGSLSSMTCWNWTRGLGMRGNISAPLKNRANPYPVTIFRPKQVTDLTPDTTTELAPDDPIT